MKKMIVALFVLAGLAAGCAREPKDSYVERVRIICGEEIANEYEHTKWRDRDYAHDALLTSCMAFKDR